MDDGRFSRRISHESYAPYDIRISGNERAVRYLITINNDNVREKWIMMTVNRSMGSKLKLKRGASKMFGKGVMEELTIVEENKAMCCVF